MSSMSMQIQLPTSNPLSVSVETPVLRSLKMLIQAGIMKCSEMYDFDGAEACSRLCVDVKSRSEIYKSELKPRSKKVREVKKKIVLPFVGVYGAPFDERCQGLCLNYGLYTQCPTIIGASTDNEAFREPYCGQCGTNPKYGKMSDRMKAYVDGTEFKDPSGKTPKAYSQVMKKLKITREEAEAEALLLGVTIDPVHFEEVVSKKSGRPQKSETQEKPDPKPKGRPKSSSTKVLELKGEEEDLFAKLVSDANQNEDNMSELTMSVAMSESDKTLEIAKVVEEEEAKKQVANSHKNKVSVLVELEKEQEKAAKKEQEKVAKEQEKAAKKEAVEREKAAKEREKAAKKEAAEREKVAKKEAAEREKAAKKAAAELKKGEPKKSALNETKEQQSAVEEVAVADVVSKLKIGDKLYYKSKSTGVIYDQDQEVVGMWNAAKNCVDFNSVDEEVDEDGYETDN